MGAFCEDSRVKFPTLMHLMGMGYKYISQRGLFTKYVTIPKTESDTLTNILLQPFSEAYLRLNPLSTQDDADAMLHRIQKSLNNDDLGRQFYKEILLDTTNKIIDLSSPTNFIRNNTFQVATEMTCGDLSCDNFRPDITIFINGLPLAFIEVKRRTITKELMPSASVWRRGLPILVSAVFEYHANNGIQQRYGIWRAIETRSLLCNHR